MGLLETPSAPWARNVANLGRIDNETTFSGGYIMRPSWRFTDIPKTPAMTEEQFCGPRPYRRHLTDEISTMD